MSDNESEKAIDDVEVRTRRLIQLALGQIVPGGEEAMVAPKDFAKALQDLMLAQIRIAKASGWVELENFVAANSIAARLLWATVETKNPALLGVPDFTCRGGDA